MLTRSRKAGCNGGDGSGCVWQRCDQWTWSLNLGRRGPYRSGVGGLTVLFKIGESGCDGNL